MARFDPQQLEQEVSAFLVRTQANKEADPTLTSHHFQLVEFMVRHFSSPFMGATALTVNQLKKGIESGNGNVGQALRREFRQPDSDADHFRSMELRYRQFALEFQQSIAGKGRPR